MQIDKKAFRIKAKQIRKSICSKTEKQNKITDNYLKNFANKNTLIYISTPNEVSTLQIINKLISAGSVVAVPVCFGDEMDFYIIENMENLNKNNFGVLEPSHDKAKKADISKFDVCVTPGLCFDKSGHRLGYGKGFYDRFLQNHKKLMVVALSYKHLVFDSIPYESHDIAVEYIVCEDGVMRCEN